MELPLLDLNYHLNIEIINIQIKTEYQYKIMGKSQSSPQLMSLLSEQYSIHPKIPNTIIHLPTQQLQTLKIIPTHSSAEQLLYDAIITQYEYNKCRSVPRLLKSHKYKKDNRYNDYCAEEINYYFIFEGSWMETDPNEQGADKLLIQEFWDRKNSQNGGIDGFSIQEIYAIICCMLCATREYYTYFHRNQWYIDLNMICIDQFSNYALTLVDPLFFQEESKSMTKPSPRKLCKYPAPQTISSLKRSRAYEIDEQQPEEYFGQLFTIGAFALQFLTMNCRQDIYQNRDLIQKYLGDRRYWSRQAALLKSQQSQELSRKLIEGISLLLSTQAHERLKAYQILNVICNKKYCLRSSRKTFEQQQNSLILSGSIMKIKQSILSEDLKVRNTPSIKQIRFPIPKNMSSNKVEEYPLKKNNSMIVINNNRELYHESSVPNLNRSMFLVKNPSSNSSQYFKTQNSQQQQPQQQNFPIQNNVSPPFIINPSPNFNHSTSYQYKIPNITFENKKNYSYTPVINLTACNQPIMKNSLHISDIKSSVPQNQISYSMKNPFSKKNVTFNYLPEKALITDIPHIDKPILFHHYSNPLPENSSNKQTVHINQSISKEHLVVQQHASISPNYNSLQRESSKRQFEPNSLNNSLKIQENKPFSEEYIFHSIKMPEEQHNKYTKQSDLYTRYHTLSTSPPKIAQSILKESSSPEIVSQKKHKYSLKSEQNVMVENLPINDEESEESPEVEQTNTALYTLKLIQERSKQKQRQIEQENKKSYQPIHEHLQSYKYVQREKDCQVEEFAPLIENVDQTRSNEIQEQEENTNNEEIVIRGAGSIKQSIQYNQEPEFYQKQKLAASLNNSRFPSNPNTKQHDIPIFKKQQKEAQENPIMIDSPRKEEEISKQQKRIDNSQLKSPPYLSLNEEETQQKCIKDGKSQEIISVELFSGLPTMSIQALNNTQDNQTLTFSSSINNNRQTSIMKQNKQSSQPKTIIDNAQSAVSIDISDSPTKQKNQVPLLQQSQKQDQIVQKQQNQRKEEEEDIQNNQQQYQRAIRLTPPHYTSTIVEEDAEEDDGSQKSVNEKDNEKSEQDIQDQLEYVVQEYETGSRYQGFKLNNIREGMGKFYYQDGGHYDGEWKNNQMHGWGKLYYESGQLAYEGYWVNDEFHGYGKVYNDDPHELSTSFDYTNFDLLGDSWHYYEGNLIRDTKQGRGRILLTNGQVFQGDFYKDRIQGFGKFLRLDGVLIEGMWRDSRLVKIIRTDDSNTKKLQK